MLNELSGLAGHPKTKVVQGPADYRTAQAEEMRGQTPDAVAPAAWAEFLEGPPAARAALSEDSPAAWTEFSEEWTEKNWQDLTRKTLEQLKKLYPSLTVTAVRPGSSVPDLAVSQGNGTHLAISEEFLKRMSGSADEFRKCSMVLSDIARRLSEQSGLHDASGAYVEEDHVSYWSAEALPPAVSIPMSGAKDQAGNQYNVGNQINAGNQNKSGKLKVSTSSNAYRVSRYHNKVAAAKSKMQVQLAISEIHRCIANLHAAALSDDQKERTKAKKAIRSLQKLLTNGNRKIRGMNQEEVTQARQKKAERNMEEKKAERARLELKKMRDDRNRKDRKLVQKGMWEDAEIQRGSGYGYQSAINAYQQMMPLPSGLVSPITPAESLPAGDVSFAAGDVVVSDVVAF